MKITKNELSKVHEIITKISFDFDNVNLFFPLDLTIHHTDEFGIESTQYKSETRYGTTFIPGLAQITSENEKYVHLAYASTTDLISFNLAEYFEIISQDQLTNEEKNFICSFECCLCRTNNNQFISNSKRIFNSKEG